MPSSSEMMAMDATASTPKVEMMSSSKMMEDNSMVVTPSSSMDQMMSSPATNSTGGNNDNNSANGVKITYTLLGSVVALALKLLL